MDGSPAVDAATAALFERAALVRLRRDPGGVLTALPTAGSPRSKRFEGLYGRLYNRVIQSDRLRRRVFALWGSTEPLQDLDGFVRAAVESAHAAAAEPVLLDVPCGGGTLLPFLDRHGFAGRVIEADLAESMMRRAAAAVAGARAPVNTVLLRADALDLPLGAACIDAAVSVNGLHVMPDARAFLLELARVMRPGAPLRLITPVSTRSLRSLAILALARRTRIVPHAPPTRPALWALVEQVGFTDLRSLGGTSITGLACRRAD